MPPLPDPAGELAATPQASVREHAAAAPSLASGSMPPRPRHRSHLFVWSSSLARAGDERSLTAGAGSGHRHRIRKPRPHPPRPPPPHPLASLCPSVVRTEERKKHGADWRRGRRSMAPTGGEEGESARDGDSTASKWEVPARAFSGDGVAPIFHKYARNIRWVGCPRSLQLVNKQRRNWDRPARPPHPIPSSEPNTALFSTCTRCTASSSLTLSILAGRTGDGGPTCLAARASGGAG